MKLGLDPNNKNQNATQNCLQKEIACPRIFPGLGGSKLHVQLNIGLNTNVLRVLYKIADPFSFQAHACSKNRYKVE